MLKTYERDKLLNAIIYFAEHTANCGKTKLFKLLFLLDLKHFQQTGKVVTGLRYNAWELGPVPEALNRELKAQVTEEPSVWSAIELHVEPVVDHTRLRVVPKRPFESDYFNKRELNILVGLAAEHERKTADEMVDVTHDENGLWARVFKNGEGRNKPLPFDLALEGEHSQEVLAKAREYEEMKSFFSCMPQTEQDVIGNPNKFYSNF